MKIKMIFYLIYLLFMIKFISAYAPVPAVSSSRLVNWSNTGLLPTTPTEADHIFYVTDYGAVPDDGNDDYNAIQAAINAAKGESGLKIIYFPLGLNSTATYNINSPINLDASCSDIVFQGDGSYKTILQFNVGNSNKCFNIYGSVSGSYKNIDANIAKGDNTFLCSSLSQIITTADINSGNAWIRLCEYNSPKVDGKHPYSIGQITRITNVSGSSYTIKDEASKSYLTSYDLRVYKVVPIKNVGIEDLKIYRNDGGDSDTGSNIFFQYAVDCWVKGVESELTCRHHIEIKYSSHIEVTGCYMHRARDYGDGGRGYGICLYFSSTNCLIENNIFRRLRHAMKVSAGANCNVFGYNYSREQVWECGGGCPDDYGPDICVHGNYPYANLFEGNCVSRMWCDWTHGRNGPYNTFLRNRTHENEWIVVLNSTYTNVIGNENALGVLDDATIAAEIFSGGDAEDSDNTFDVYFWSYSDPGDQNCIANGITHEGWYAIQQLGAEFVQVMLGCSWLDDVSYYRSSRPSFMDVLPYIFIMKIVTFSDWQILL
jgi:hypothetical protein